MNTPTVEEMLDNIQERALYPAWFDGGMYQLYREDGILWYRHPDRDAILKITVEELSRDQWPSAPIVSPPEL